MGSKGRKRNDEIQGVRKTRRQKGTRESKYAQVGASVSKVRERKIRGNT